MKPLQLNPEKHEIELQCNCTNQDYAEVDMKFGETSVSMVFNHVELRKMAAWLDKLADKVEPNDA